MKILSFLFLLASCAQVSKLQYPTFNGEKAKRRQFYQITNKGDILQAASEGTISLWFKESGDRNLTQDLISISVGDKKLPTTTSRASIRVLAGGYLHAFARSKDQELPQAITSEKAVVKDEEWHHVAFIIDYANNSLELYFDGKKIPAKGQDQVRFKARLTDNTPSLHITLGAEDDGSDYYFDGKIRAVHVIRRKLTSEEIERMASNIQDQTIFMR